MVRPLAQGVGQAFAGRVHRGFLAFADGNGEIYVKVASQLVS
jgi:hypothetical protein